MAIAAAFIFACALATRIARFEPGEAAACPVF